MKSAFDWIIKNLWNLFGVLGVLGTFYFSLAYVPDYVRDINSGKVSVIHEDLIDDVQEILFYEKDISIEDIKAFIEGKELTQDVAYPYTPDELLVQVQDRFMGNKFIPLEKREALLNQIKVIRAAYVPPLETVQKSDNWLIVFSWLVAGIGASAAVLGATSIVRKIKQDKETEIDIASGEEIYRSPNDEVAISIYDFEKMVGEVLGDLGVLKFQDQQIGDTGIDFVAEKDGIEYIVEVKRYRKLLGLGTAQSFMYQVSKSGKRGILVVSSNVTQRTRQLIAEHNQMYENQRVYLIVGESRQKIEKQLAKIFE